MCVTASAAKIQATQTPLQTESWMQIYDLRSIARFKVQTCDDCPGCQLVDLDTHMLYHRQDYRSPENRSMQTPLMENCTLLQHEMRSYSGWCHRRMVAIASASARVRQRGRNVLCVGPLNDFLSPRLSVTTVPFLVAVLARTRSRVP